MKNNNFKNFSYKKKGPALREASGFTIIELVISIFVLSIAVVGIFNALSVITILTADSADRLTATYLAQEGMEIVRNIRDTNWLNMNAGIPYSWDNGLTEGGLPNGTGCTDTSPCKADYKSETLVRGADKLSLDNNGFYVYGADLTETKFKRKIIVDLVTDAGDSISTSHVLNVKVEVSWDKKSTTLNSFISADHCCPDSTDPMCTPGTSNCITSEETLYNLYNTKILVAGVKIYDPLNINPEDPRDVDTPLSKSGNQTDTLTAKTNPLNATNQAVTWNSSDETCILVSVTGIVSIPLAASVNCRASVTVETTDGGWTYETWFIVVP